MCILYVADSQYFRTSIIEQYVFHMRCLKNFPVLQFNGFHVT